MKNVCIVFNGGSYGTFVEWCLNLFSDQNFSYNLPFTDSGNAHRFIGNHLFDVEGCKKYINGNDNFQFVRTHLYNKKNDNLLKNLNLVSQNFQKIIYLTPSYETIAWNINNKFDKLFPNGWLNETKKTFEKQLLKWGNYTDHNAMKPWELREFLSFFLFKAHVNEAGMKKIPHIIDNYKNVNVIYIDELKNDFEGTINKLLKYCQLIPVNMDKIPIVYENWKACQIHIDKDEIIKNIVDSVVNGIDFSWRETSLTLVDEALIQYYLRQHKIEIKCYNLNDFPKNTEELRKYLD